MTDLSPNATDNAAGRTHLRPRAAMPRRQGVVSGVLLVLLAIWVGFIPYLGPYMGYGFDASSLVDVPVVTLNRVLLTTVPAIVLALGGVLLGASGNRPTAGLGALIGLVGGVWLIVGPAVSVLWGAGGPGLEIGTPIGPNWVQALSYLGVFYGVGAVAVAVTAFGLGRVFVSPAQAGGDQSR